MALAAEQAQLYASLQAAYEELTRTQQAAMQQERLRALGQMASGVAHDINNAISPVSLYTEAMLESEPGLTERTRRYLETIKRSVESVAQTVARLREFYRQREDQLELAPLDPNVLAQQVIELTEPRWRDMAQQQGLMIEARLELAPDCPKVMGVESEIREALTNLVFNAIDAMPAGGALTLRTRVIAAPEDAGVVAAVAIEVVDSGIGMDEETRRRCLEPFFTTKGERGTGLGLAMVYGTVRRHSAGLEIDSTPGAGTTMRLVFAVPTGDLAEPDRAMGPRVDAGLRLLIVDDDPVLLRALREVLEGDGHQVVAVGSGQAGIDAFRTQVAAGSGFDAVFTDLGMPHVDGRKVAAGIKQVAAATPVVMLTGWGERMVAEGELPEHVDCVLAKPPRLREVRRALVQLCRKAVA